MQKFVAAPHGLADGAFAQVKRPDCFILKPVPVFYSERNLSYPLFPLELMADATPVFRWRQ